MSTPQPAPAHRSTETEGGATSHELDSLYELIDQIQVAMMTSVTAEGRLVSRPMVTIERDDAGHLWFMTSVDTEKVAELLEESEVNLAYFDDDSRGWVSVSGTARLTRDRDRIRELYEDRWGMWLPEDGEGRVGRADDPRIVLIDVTPKSAVYYAPRSRPMQLLEVLKGRVTGRRPDLGELKETQLR